MLAHFIAWDQPVFFLFQTIQCPAYDLLLGYPTILGNTFFLVSIISVLIFFLDYEKAAEKITTVVFGVLTSYWFVSFLKDHVNRPRPHEIWDNVTLIFGRGYTESFPSGHTATVFAAAYAINTAYKGRMPWLYAVAAWIGITRIYIGVHYPTDVLAGAVIGTACSALAIFFLSKITAHRKKEPGDAAKSAH